MLTEENREARRKYIGSSDAAAIVGLNPYKTAYDVFLEKTYQTDDFENEAIELGNVFESAILDWGIKKLGIPLFKPNNAVIHPNGFMAFNPDGLNEELKRLAEVKVAGVLSYLVNEWGDIDTDEVPPQFNIQGQHGMACMGVDWKSCDYPALLGGVGLRLYRVERDDELIDSLIALEEKFMRDHVRTGLPPDTSFPTMEVVKRIRRIAAKTAKIDSNLILNWNQAKELAREAEKALDQAKATLIAALGDAEEGKSELGSVTYFEQTRKGFEVQPTKFRVLREKKSKGAKNAA